MQSLIPNCLVFGSAGQGKSTFLNHIIHGPNTDIEEFETGEAGSSCTKTVSPGRIATIWGTKTKICLYDTPGVLAADMNLTTWFETMKNGCPNPVNILIWVSSIHSRALITDVIISQAFELVFDHYTPESVVLVFTHCDELEKKSCEDAGEEWIKSINKGLVDKTKLKVNHRVYFGKRNGKKFQIITT